MSGWGELGLEYGANAAGVQIAPKDIDAYVQYEVQYPSANFSWFGTVNSATANAPFVLVNALPDYPRTMVYSVTGVAGGMGGTFTASYINQFGQLINETKTIGSAAGGGTAYGTGIVAKFISGSFSPAGLGGTAIGTASLGLGTATGGLGTGNWFGLPTKLGGTADLVNITWANNGTVTTLNKGTSIGSLVNTTVHGFQGTSGVAITDFYSIILSPSFDNVGKGTMAAL